MNSLLYYYNNVQMAAFRQAKRMQRGVKLGYNQSPTADSATKFTGGAVPIGVGDFSVEYFGNSYGSGAYPFLCSVSGTFSCRSAAVGQNGVSSIIVGDSDDPIQVGWAAQSSEDRFYLAVTRSGVTVKVYINGELKATKEQSAVKDLGDLQLAIANSSDVGFVRVWNYALSADDVTAHYNNGDPMGYVVPKLYRQFGPSIEPTANTFEFNIGSPYSRRVTPVQQYPFDCIYRIDFVVDEWDYQPQAYGSLGFLGISGATILTPLLNWETAEIAKVGELQSIIVKMHGTGNPLVHIFGGRDNDAATARHLKVTINSITPVGLLAEYLPQNLMYGNDNKTIAGSWLDSAKQLPLSDEYMEPLFQSIGGYDMAANGAPEILYNE